MHAFLKGGKLPTGKPAANGSQKQKDKKQREKPVPWVEKVKSEISQSSQQIISLWFPFSIVQRKLMTLWSSRKFAQCLESACRAPTCPTCFCTVLLVSLSCFLINCNLTLGILRNRQDEHYPGSCSPTLRRILQGTRLRTQRIG